MSRADRIERKQLTEVERCNILARIRADRLARKGAPVFNLEAVKRETCASMRLAGVDARSWLWPEGAPDDVTELAKKDGIA